MSDLIRQVRDIDAGDLAALEHLLGVRLENDQQIVIRVVNQSVTKSENPDAPATSSGLPAWCNVYEDLSDAEVAEIEESIVR